jgi:hypothetical protein
MTFNSIDTRIYLPKNNIFTSAPILGKYNILGLINPGIHLMLLDSYTVLVYTSPLHYREKHQVLPVQREEVPLHRKHRDKNLF